MTDFTPTPARPGPYGLSAAAILAAVLISLVCAVVLLLFFVPAPDQNRDAINLVLGALLGWIAAIVTFYFGSSKSSQSKDDTIATATQALADNSAKGNAP